MSTFRTSPGGTAVGAALSEQLLNKNLYACLGVSPRADTGEIRTAYHRAALTAHPDKGGTSEAFQNLQAAFKVLSCPEARRIYDDCFWEADKHSRTSKRQQSAATGHNPASGLAKRIDRTLTCLRSLLQQMDKPLRSSSMETIPVPVQKALIDFMKTCPLQVTDDACAVAEASKKRSGSVRVVTCGSRRHAQLDMEHLRFYFRSGSVDDARKGQIIFTNIRDKLLEAGAQDINFWKDSRVVCKLFEKALAEHDTSMVAAGCSVYVEMRAPEWVANNHHITSPVLPLAEAIDLRNRLLKARASSWDSVRAEWIEILQRGRFGHSLKEAEARVDAARRSFLLAQLAAAVSDAEKVLDLRRAADDAKKRKHLDSKHTSCTARIPKKLKTERAQHADEKWPYLSAARLLAHTKTCEAFQI